eukprot:6199375-Pleurochrysis_carterae.AAC.8
MRRALTRMSVVLATANACNAMLMPVVLAIYRPYERKSVLTAEAGPSKIIGAPTSAVFLHDSCNEFHQHRIARPHSIIAINDRFVIAARASVPLRRLAGGAHGH